MVCIQNRAGSCEVLEIESQRQTSWAVHFPSLRPGRPGELPFGMPISFWILMNWGLFWSSCLCVTWQLSNRLPEILWPIVGNGKLSSRLAVIAMLQLFVSHVLSPEISVPFSSELWTRRAKLWSIIRLALDHPNLPKRANRCCLNGGMWWGLSTWHRGSRSQPWGWH